MRLYIGDDRGQLKLLDGASSAVVKMMTKMDRARGISAIEATGGQYNVNDRAACEVQDLEEGRDILNEGRCELGCFTEAMPRHVIESEITVGRLNGMVQAYDLGAVEEVQAFLDDPAAATRECNQKTLDYEAEPCRSFKLTGKIIMVKHLGGYYCHKKYPELKNAIVAVSDQNEIVVVKWGGNALSAEAKPSKKDKKGKKNRKGSSKVTPHLSIPPEAFGELKGAKFEEAAVPLRPAWYQEIDFRAKFGTVANSRKKRDCIKAEINFFNKQEETVMFNQALLEEQAESPPERPAELLYAWRLKQEDPQTGFNIRCADVDVWSGRPLVMVGGTNMMVRVLDLVTGEPVWAPRNRAYTALDLQQCGDARVCAFLSHLGDGSSVVVGTRVGEMLLYDRKDESRQPGYVMTGSEDHSALTVMATRPRRAFGLDGKSFLRPLPEGGFPSAGVAASDFQGYGLLWTVRSRPLVDDQGRPSRFRSDIEFVPKESKDRRLEKILFRTPKHPGIILEMKKGFEFMMDPTKGFHPWIGTPVAMGIHDAGLDIAFASAAQRVYSYKTRKARGIQRGIVHKFYTTTNPSAILVSNTEVDEPEVEYEPKSKRQRLA